jgi:hypothetical protein
VDRFFKCTTPPVRLVAVFYLLPIFLDVLRLFIIDVGKTGLSASIAGSTRRRPSLFPFALASARPAFTLSQMIPHSNSVELMDRLRSPAAAL